MNPTGDEIRKWAYADAYAPFEDFEMVLDGADVLPVVIACAEDPGCPSRQFLLTSLYCTVGHLQPGDRARVRTAVAGAICSADPAVRTWATRAAAVIDGDEAMNRDQWCGFPSLAVTHPVDTEDPPTA